MLRETQHPTGRSPQFSLGAQLDRRFAHLYRYALPILNVLLALLLLAVMVHFVIKPKTYFAGDFHAYWNGGHFVLAGQDPYANPFAGIKPPRPVRYLDGAQFNPEALPVLVGTIPGITAPLLLLVTPLARFSFWLAYLIWTAVNLLALGMIGWSVARMLDQPLWAARSILVMLLTALLMASRETVQGGQSGLVTFGALVAALALGRRHPWLSGLLLGVALSKPSLTFPGVVPFLFLGWFRPLIIAAGVQLSGILVLVALTDATILGTVETYLQMATFYAGAQGMHLTQGLLADTTASPWLIALNGGALGLVAVDYLRRRVWSMPGPMQFRYLSIVLAILMLLNVLTLYHRRYDNLVAMLMLAVIIFDVGTHPKGVGRLFLYGATVLIASVWILPFNSFLAAKQYIVLFNIATLAALVVLLVHLWRAQWTDLSVAHVHPGASG